MIQRSKFNFFIGQVSHYRFSQFGTNRDYTLFITLSQCFYGTVVQVKMVVLKLYELGLPDAGIVKYLQNKPFGFALPVIGKFNMVEQGAYVFLVDKLGELFGYLGIYDGRHGACLQIALANAVFKKRFKRRNLSVDSAGSIIFFAL